MDIISTISLAMGAGWASGLNLYATVFMLGIMQATGNMVLPPELQVLANPLVLTAAGIMYAVEFLADKIPGVDTLWDTLHTFIRIPAGAMLAAGAVGDMGMAAEFSALLLGGGLAAGSHATKAGSRVMMNASPEPFSNWTASVTEDAAVFGGLWAALNHPWVFLGLLAVFILFMAWLLPKIWRGIKKVFGWLFGKDKEVPPQEASPPEDKS